jgi:hypothetical protein
MYKLQWAFIKDADGNNISPDNFVYHDTVFEYEDWDDAEIDRIDLMKEAKDKYIRIVEV